MQRGRGVQFFDGLNQLATMVRCINLKDNCRADSGQKRWNARYGRHFPYACGSRGYRTNSAQNSDAVEEPADDR